MNKFLYWLAILALWLVFEYDSSNLCGYRHHNMLNWNWYIRYNLHVAAELSRNFFQNLLCEVSILHRLCEFHELHDIALARSPLVVSQGTSIAVKFIHA